MSQLFEQALIARLQALTGVTSLLQTSNIFKSGFPQTIDLNSGPVLTYSIPTKPYGHVLTGSDGTSVARVQLDVWDFTVAGPKKVLEAIRNGIDGLPGTWGDGTVTILSVVQQDDIDADEEPKAGSDQWLYHSIAEYAVKYRVSIPTLS